MKWTERKNYRFALVLLSEHMRLNVADFVPK